MRIDNMPPYEKHLGYFYANKVKTTRLDLTDNAWQGRYRLVWSEEGRGRSLVRQGEMLHCRACAKAYMR
jgi:hypothetical protein